MSDARVARGSTARATASPSVLTIDAKRAREFEALVLLEFLNDSVQGGRGIAFRPASSPDSWCHAEGPEEIEVREYRFGVKKEETATDALRRYFGKTATEAAKRKLASTPPDAGEAQPLVELGTFALNDAIDSLAHRAGVPPLDFRDALKQELGADAGEARAENDDEAALILSMENVARAARDHAEHVMQNEDDAALLRNDCAVVEAHAEKLRDGRPEARPGDETPQQMYEKLLAQKKAWFAEAAASDRALHEATDNGALADALGEIRHFAPAAMHWALNLAMHRLESARAGDEPDEDVIADRDELTRARVMLSRHHMGGIFDVFRDLPDAIDQMCVYIAQLVEERDARQRKQPSDDAYRRLDSFATGGPDPDLETLRRDVLELLGAFDARADSSRSLPDPEGSGTTLPTFIASRLIRDLTHALDAEAEMFKPGRMHHNGPRRIEITINVQDAKLLRDHMAARRPDAGASDA